MARRVAGVEGGRAGGRSAAWIEAESGRGLCLAGQLSRAGAVREERADPARLPAVAQRARTIRWRSSRNQRAPGALTADELLQRYVTIVYSRRGSYEETARRLGLDRRTVKAKVDAALLARLRGGVG